MDLWGQKPEILGYNLGPTRICTSDEHVIIFFVIPYPRSGEQLVRFLRLANYFFILWTTSGNYPLPFTIY